MLTLLPNAFTFSGSLAGSLPATVCTGLLRESKFELDTNSGNIWNCRSLIFLPSFRELRKPALRFEKAESSGARMVMPPLFAVISCFGVGRPFAGALGASTGVGETPKVLLQRSSNNKKEKMVACFIFLLPSQACIWL
ncbi:hypothetical protein VNO78_05656 [Psophocarpus tetragonolobus]|uniref:Uncharacterized protein n=1 Tax=Psophocarpus tetragonolobus TaxID=3891 RepID=A0AAN9SS41_PSOTE